MGWVGGGGGDYLREAIILNISVWGWRLFEGGNYSRDGYYSRNMVAWVAGIIKGRGRKVQKVKGSGSCCHKNLCFCMLPTRFPNVKSTDTTWPSTFHFSMYRNVNNVLEKGIPDLWSQIPPKSKYHAPQNGQYWLPPNKNSNYVMGLVQFIYEN